MSKQKVCAVIPAYKEEKRIRNVLIPIKQVVGEIIVVEDGSNDLDEITQQFDIKLLKNKKNEGKGYCMNLGVKNTSCPIILFCDADMKDLTPEIIREVIRPVKENKHEMFIGLRNTWSNRHGIGLLSGLRAIKKNAWERLPNFYKKGFRVEIGLNYFIPFGYGIFDYHQEYKEKKYNLLYSLYRRFFMYLNVLFAWLMLGVGIKFKWGLK